ncbi:MAG: hypothetical protein Q4G39_03360 [Brachymonas sp.]|nr:hypothetical protein [Brachymonas sp.]
MTNPTAQTAPAPVGEASQDDVRPALELLREQWTDVHELIAAMREIVTENDTALLRLLDMAWSKQKNKKYINAVSKHFGMDAVI